VLQLNLTEDHCDDRPANLRQTHGGRYGRPDGVLHHAWGHDLPARIDLRSRAQPTALLMSDLTAQLLELAVANRILAHEAVVDALRHVSIRHPEKAD
jgi:hypothetical protein